LQVCHAMLYSNKLQKFTNTGVLPSFSRPQALRCSSRICDSAAMLLAKRSGLFSVSVSGAVWGQKTFLGVTAQATSVSD